jgi:hypothetical protein
MSSTAESAPKLETSDPAREQILDHAGASTCVSIPVNWRQAARRSRIGEEDTSFAPKKSLNGAIPIRR